MLTFHCFVEYIRRLDVINRGFGLDSGDWLVFDSTRTLILAAATIRTKHYAYSPAFFLHPR